MNAPAKNMQQIPGGRFLMGDERFYPEEAPMTAVEVEGFWMDQSPTTNAEFRRFVKDTGHVTAAERAPDPRDFPGAADADLVPGSLVFHATEGPVPLDDWTQWWRWVPGADWRHPAGPESTLHGRDLHPVVHVALEDALAYAAWAGKELPTEAEWEFAARGGLESAVYAWGDDFMPKERVMANTWHGSFPWHNSRAHGYDGTSPVGRFPPNAYGLHDMTGNVWEWTHDRWSPDHRARHGGAPAVAGDPDQVSPCCAPTTFSETDRWVTKGGSHLCAPSYCLRYRPAARQGQAVRSSTAHLGFRCVIRQSPAG